MMILTPWELARINKVEVVKRLQENGCILLALKNRGRKGGYNRPFAALIEWPPTLATFEAIDTLSSNDAPLRQALAQFSVELRSPMPEEVVARIEEETPEVPAKHDLTTYDEIKKEGVI